MKMKNTVIGVIIAVTQSKWMRPAPMTLAILVAVLRVTGPLDPARLESALAEVERRHEALRTIFAEDAGDPVQIRMRPQQKGQSG